MATTTEIELDDGRTVHEFDAKADGKAETVTGWVDGLVLKFETEGGESGQVRKVGGGVVKFDHKITVCGIAGVKKLPTTDAWAGAMNDDIETAREEHRAAEREKELTFRVGVHENRLTQSKTPVLVAEKTQLTDDDREFVEELRDELGTVGGGAHGPGEILAFEGAEFDEKFTADEVRAKLRDSDETDDHEGSEGGDGETREHEADTTELREEHPELRGVSFDPDGTESAFEEAQRTGESVVVATGGSECDGSEPECSWDRITVRAMPDGTAERERVHTH